MNTVAFSLGSNLGDRVANLQEALRRLTTLSIGKVRSASLYETVPVDCPPGSNYFLNTVIELETKLAPEELLSETQRFEAELGRPSQRERNAPRSVDIDILYFADRVMETPSLVIPHPRMSEREFVLRPLQEIRPDLVSLAELTAVKDPTYPVKEFRARWW